MSAYRTPAAKPAVAPEPAPVKPHEHRQADGSVLVRVCRPPAWWQRWRLGVCDGDTWRCGECGKRWVWTGCYWNRAP